MGHLVHPSLESQELPQPYVIPGWMGENLSMTKITASGCLAFTKEKAAGVPIGIPPEINNKLAPAETPTYSYCIKTRTQPYSPKEIPRDSNTDQGVQGEGSQHWSPLNT